MTRIFTVVATCLALSALSCGVDHTGIHTAGNMKLATEGCVRAAACYELGRHYMRLTAASMSFDWDEPRDPAKARAVWKWGCSHGEATSCRAIVEYGVAANEAEKQRYTLRAAFYSLPVRTPEEVDKEQQEYRTQARAGNQEIQERNAQEEAQAQADWQQGMAAVGQTVQQIGTTIQNGQGGGAAGAAPGAAGGQDKCAPCSGHTAKLNSACKESPQSAGCYCAAAAMHQCVHDTDGCSTNREESQNEANRMRQAARDAGGGC